MASSEFPEKFTEHGKEFNRTSRHDPNRLPPRERQRYNLLEEQKESEIQKITADNERYRDQRIDKEIDRMLRKPEPGMNGPTPPTIGGRRLDQPEGPSRDGLSPQQLKNLRETAEQTIRRQEREVLERSERTYTQAQRDLLDRTLGQNRYPKRRR